MTKPQTQEQQKVAEWAESLGLRPRYADQNIVGFYNDDIHSAHYITLTVATFFYRAAHPEPVAGDEDLRKQVKYWLSYRRPMLDDNEGLDQIMSAFHQKRHVDRQRILDRVEEEGKKDFIVYPLKSLKEVARRRDRRWLAVLARIRKEEL